MFCVKNVVFNAFLPQKRRKVFGFVNADCSDQNGAAFFVHFYDFIHNRQIFLFLRFVDYVGHVDSYVRFVCRDGCNFKVVNFAEFCFFGHCSTGHAGKFRIKSEKILESYACKGLSFVLNFCTLFCFNRLMKSVRPAAPFHQSACKFVNNDDFAVFDYIIRVFLVEFFCFQRLQKMMCVLIFHIKQV